MYRSPDRQRNHVRAPARVFAFSSSPSPTTPFRPALYSSPSKHTNHLNRHALRAYYSDWKVITVITRLRNTRCMPAEEASIDQGISFKSPIISFSVLLCRLEGRAVGIECPTEVPGDRLVKFCDIQIIRMRLPLLVVVPNESYPFSFQNHCCNLRN